MKGAKSKPKDLKTILTYLAPALRPRRAEFLLGVSLVFLSTLCEVVAPFLFGKGVDVVMAPSPQRRELVYLALAFLGAILLRAMVETLRGWVIQRTGQKVTHDLRVMVFEKIHSLPIGYFDSHSSGSLLTRVVNDIKAVSELFTASISVLILNVMVILGSLASMFWFEWKLAAFVLLSFPLVFGLVWYFGEKLNLAYEDVRSRLAEMNGFLGENIAAIPSIQRLGAETVRFQKFETIVDNHTDAQMKLLRVLARVQPYTNVLNGISMATLLGLGGYWVIEGRFSLGVVVSFIAYLRNLFQPIRDLVEKYNTFLSARVGASRIVGVLEEPSEEETGRWAVTQGEEVLENTTISFRDVSFQYASRDTLALDRVSFSAVSGQSLAIVGATGSGKSTLMRLLMRFYDPSEGKIEFGGRDLRDWNRQQLRRSIGVIQQEVYLFSGSIRENLCLGKSGWSDEDLEKECRRTGFWDLIKERGGLAMRVMEGGSNLSLGERQLLAFTRAWVFKPKVLVLDEATASMDPISEKYVMNAVREGIKGRTSIVIAHRLSTIRLCDAILVMQHGRVAEYGTYESLLKKRGLFFEFHRIYTHLS